MSKQRIRMNRRRRGGFTLIELLLVLAILAILATIVVTSTSGQTEKARKTKAAAEVSALKDGIKRFEQDVGRFPSPEEGLNALVQQPADAVGWKPPYIEGGQLPKDPWEREYVYVVPGKHNTFEFDVFSMGPDGKADTEDDIGNWRATSANR